MRFSSKNLKFLVFSDSHTDWKRLDKIVNHESPDVILDLGDHFDSHTEVGIGVRENREMALWLKGQFKNPNYYVLHGNHTLHYCYANRFFRSSGYTDAKDLEINSVLSREDWDNFGNFFILDDFILTHAGIHPYYLPIKQNYDIEWMENWLMEEEIKCHLTRKSGQQHWFYNCGHVRGGKRPFGGLFWRDCGEQMLNLDGVKEIFGHTFQRNLKVLKYDNGSYCIDTRLNEWITITNGKLEIKKLVDL